jgi:site-specific recombinase XerD
MTLRNNEHALRKFDRWLREHGHDAADVAPLHVEEYFETLLSEYQVSTAQRHLSTIRAAYAYAIKVGKTTSDPTATVELPRLPDAEPATYTNDELRAIDAVLTSRGERQLLYLLAYAGLRRFECTSLRYADVDEAHQQLRILGKGGKLRRVPVQPRLAHVLESDRDAGCFVLRTKYGLPMSVRTFNSRLQEILDRANVDGGLRPAHKFRKTVATSLNENGARESVIDQILGWAPSTVRSRYYTRIGDDLSRRTILLVYGDDEALAGTSVI